MKLSLCSLFALNVALLSGCISAKYKMAKPNETAPAVTLNLTSKNSFVEASLDTVIAFQGPGSWKREAYWDEYVITVKNKIGKPLTVESASLVGLSEKPSTPWRDPWALEEASRDAEKWRFGLPKDGLTDVDHQMGGGFAAFGAGALIGASGSAGAIGGATAGALGGGVLFLPVYIGGTIYGNISHRHAVEKEFQSRRLELPITLSSDQAVHGSLFFLVTPGPQRLTLRCSAGDAPFEVIVDLASLASLHLMKTKPATAVPAVK